jgi:carnosine N-methyltransferase
MGMCAGDFVQAFGGEEYEGHFDAVACSFFIDTAHNIIEYLEVIWHTLRVRVFVQ